MDRWFGVPLAWWDTWDDLIDCCAVELLERAVHMLEHGCSKMRKMASWFCIEVIDFLSRVYKSVPVVLVAIVSSGGEELGGLCSSARAVLLCVRIPLLPGPCQHDLVPAVEPGFNSVLSEIGS